MVNTARAHRSFCNEIRSIYGYSPHGWDARSLEALPPSFCSYPSTHLGGERHCESQSSDPSAGSSLGHLI